MGDGEGKSAGYILCEKTRGALDREQCAGMPSAMAAGAAVQGVRGIGASTFILPGWPMVGFAQRTELTSGLEGVPLAAVLRDYWGVRAGAGRPVRRLLQKSTERWWSLFQVVEAQCKENTCSNNTEIRPLDRRCALEIIITVAV